MNTNLPISEIMSTDLITVKDTDQLLTIEEKFKNHPIHHLPVVGKDYALVGIISKADMLHIARIIEHDASGTTYINKVYESWTATRIMTSQPLTLDPDDSIGLVADIFLQNKFHAIPVIEDFRLVGIVTSHDLLKHAYAQVSFPEVEG
ncbi:MAG: CBS domain-containing protein [Saprospiraceae bacterium]|nr:CBS domain-containing protein [Saprospiraceae bacterium]